MARRRTAKVMNDIAGLVIIPPAQIPGFDADGVKAGFDLLDLFLESAMGEEKEVRVIEQNFHVICRTSALVLLA